MNAYLADLLFRWAMYFDERSGRAKLFIHRARVCLKCKQPIKRNERHHNNPYRHIDCAYPMGVYPIAEPLGSYVAEGDDAA